MKHNFPPDKVVICKQKLTLAQTKEIFKMCIDVDIPIYEDTLKKPLDDVYPFLIFSSNNTLSQDTGCWIDNSYIEVSHAEFKAFLRGKGKYTPPPKPITLSLNDEYDAEISKDGVKVGCQTFTHEIIDKLHALSKKMRKKR